MMFTKLYVHAFFSTEKVGARMHLNATHLNNPHISETERAAREIERERRKRVQRKGDGKRNNNHNNKNDKIRNEYHHISSVETCSCILCAPHISILSNVKLFEVMHRKAEEKQYYEKRTNIKIYYRGQ